MTHFPIKDLKRAEYNPRIMPDQEMQSLMKSIEIHGFCEPIVVNIAKDRYGIIVGGHQRMTAIEKILSRGNGGPTGLKQTETGWEIPCFTVELTLEAEKQLNIALNKIHGKFDEEKIFNLIVEMKDSPTLLSTGFSESDIASILDRGEQTEKTTETHSIKAECGRCLELKLQVLGHAKRSGHPIGFDDHVDQEK